MKFILISIIFIIIIFLIYNKYNIENFSTNNNDIELPINDKYLPININAGIDKRIESNKKYMIINMYKSILNRQPTKQELINGRLLTDNELKMQLLNNPEYNHMVNMQNNDAIEDIEGEIAKEDLLQRIKQLYKEEKNKDINPKMLLPLRDCMIHMQYNEYLMKALLDNNNYNKFEKEVLSNKMLTKDILLELFNEHFDLLELKLVANDIIKYELLNGRNNNNKPETLVNINQGSLIDNNDNKYFNKQVNQILNNHYSSSTSTPPTGISTPTATLTTSTPTPTTSTSTPPSGTSSENFDIYKNNYNNDNNLQLYQKIYKPVKYTQEYRTQHEYKENICTSINQKQLKKPIFIESKSLFQGTDLDTAFEETQVGSIMPKFEYREFEYIKTS